MKNYLTPYTSARFRSHFKGPKSFILRRKVPWWYQIRDPDSYFISEWYRIFLITCLIALFLDPLYFFLPIIGGPACIRIDFGLGIFVTFFRTITDLFRVLHILIKFRTAYLMPSSRVLGRGELVRDPNLIAMRYLKTEFIIDVAAALPLPQIVIWFVIPAVKDATAARSNHTLSLIVLIQFFPRLILIIPLNRRINKTSQALAQTAWSGAAYNLFLYLLASHVIGASWYVASMQRQHECWKRECKLEMNTTHSPSCRPFFLDCDSIGKPERRAWLDITQLIKKCDALDDDNKNFEFGMFADAFKQEVASANMIDKYFYCLWWGLKALSSYGQDLKVSLYIGETLFCIAIASVGLVLFAHLIGQMQSFLQSTTARLEEWRIRLKDTEAWMRHRQLPMELQEKIRRFVQYKWIATRGVDEETILQDLPLDLRRQIQRHLCLALVRRVPFFTQMDDQLLDAICERLTSSLNTKHTYIIREGDPVNEMLFIIRGQLESSTTNGGRSGFFNSITLRPGDFCGEELLTWALMPVSGVNYPNSTRTVKSITEVEAFALQAEDLKFVATQFKRLHNKKLQHAFRYYSHQWRTWGACFIQAAWRRYRARMHVMELARQEEYYYYNVMDQDDYYDDDGGGDSKMQNPNKMQSLGATILARRFAVNTRRGIGNKVGGIDPNDHASLKMPKLFKPKEPDFSAFNEDT